MTQDELDAAIAQRAGLNIIKKGAKGGGAHEMAREALRLQREGWRPEPKPSPEMVKAIEVFHEAHAAWDDIRNEGIKAAINSGARMIADAIAQAVADARVKVPEDIRVAYESWRYTPKSLQGGVISAWLKQLIAAEDEQ
jgi:hypothetical protein